MLSLIAVGRPRGRRSHLLRTPRLRSDTTPGYQIEQRPFGDDGGDGWGDKLHAWYADADDNQAEIDQITAAHAFIMGRNMFGPVRGQWDRPWTGWWGDDPPYHAPVYVLTHHPRDPQPMDGGPAGMGGAPASGLPPVGSSRREPWRARRHPVAPGLVPDDVNVVVGDAGAGRHRYR